MGETVARSLRGPVRGGWIRVGYGAEPHPGDIGLSEAATSHLARNLERPNDHDPTTAMMTTLWSGLAVGSMYALVALQFDLVFAATKIFNFAQIGLLVVSGFTASVLLVGQGVPWLVVLLVLAVGGALFGALQEVLTVRPLMRRGEHDAHPWIVTTLGLGTVMQGVALLIWGTDPRRVPFPGSNSSFSLGGGRLLPVDLALIVVAIVVTLGLRVALTHTRRGLLMLATAADRDLAMLRGIDVSRVQLAAFAMGGALVATATLLIGPITFASLTMGQRLVIFAFIVLAVGGFGTQNGALVGGLCVGLVEAFATYLIGVDEAQLIVFALLIGVLLARPSGLFTKANTRVV